MLKGGLLPSPIIIPLSSSPLSLKNKIDTQTFIELRSDVPNVRIHFTVDGTKPDPFRNSSTSTNLYRGVFRLGSGKRIVKAMAVTNDGTRESQVTTKYFDVNDNYSDNDQSLIDRDQSQHNFDRSVWNEAFNIERSISPVNQVHVQNTPRENWIDPQYGYMREQIPEYIPPPPPPRIVEVIHEEEHFWDRKTKPLSPGNGNWKKTLEHLFLNIYNFVKNEQELRELFGWKLFGRIETARLIDKGKTYQILTTFKKPLGEQTPYEEPPPRIRKPHPKHRSKKRIRTPPDTEEEKPIRRPPSLSSVVPMHEEEEDEEEKRTPRIYTEEIDQQGTLVPYPDFHAERDCENLRKAMKHAETDENILIDILGNRTSDQRVKIRDKYKTMFSRDLDADFRGDTSGSFRHILKKLFYSPVEYDCYELHRAIKGLAIDEEVLIEILTSRSNKRLQAINNLYPQLFNRTLEEDIVSDIIGPVKKILIVLVHGQRPESNRINEDQVKKDAKSLYEAGEHKWGTDQSRFIQILSTRSDVQLKAVFEAYRHFSKQDIEADIKGETSGSLRKGLLAIVRIMRNPPGFFAYRLKNALKDTGTDEDELNRVILSRCEVDMVQIKIEYENIMKRSLEEHIESDTSDDYQRILLELLKDPSQRHHKKAEKQVEKRKHEKVDLPGYEQPEIYREEIIEQGTMVAARHFDANRDADALRKAMKGAGTTERTLIDILGNRNTTQRLEIKSAFKSKHNRDLVKDLKSETSGNFSNLLERLMMDPVELDCFELKQAVKGAGTDEEALIEILASRSNERIRSIKETYQKMYSKPLDKDVRSDTSGDFRRLLVTLLQGRRPETTEGNIDKIKKDAKSLVDAGAKRFGSDEARFNALFCDRSDSQLKAIFDEFEELTGKSIEEMVKKETSGDHQRGILAVIRCIKSRPHFFAEQLRNAIKGMGTKESTLNRIIITRSEIDLVQIKAAYQHLFHRELERDVRSDTSGNYEKLLLEILKDPSQRS